MRLLMTNLLASAMVLFGAATAGAFSSSMTSDYLGGALNVGDQVNVEIFFDATAKGVQFFTVAVQWDPAVFQYNSQSNASVGVPTYLLYGLVGTGMAAMNTYVVPLQDPWLVWGGSTNPPGVQQVNIAWYDPSFVGAGGTGLVKVGEIQLEVIATPSATSTIALSNNSGGTILQVFDVAQPNPTSGDFVVNLAQIPEPTTAVLVGLGLVGLGFAGRRRA